MKERSGIKHIENLKYALASLLLSAVDRKSVDSFARWIGEGDGGLFGTAQGTGPRVVSILLASRIVITTKSR